MIDLLSPKIDLVFKLLFIDQPELLKDLLNQILTHYGYPALETIEIRNPQILSVSPEHKFVVLDIHAVDENGRSCDVEMQAQKFDTYPNRTLYYLSKLYSQQLRPGRDYTALQPVFGVHFLDYALFPENERYRYCFELRERHDPLLRLTDHLALFLFELPKLPESSPSALEQWLHFLAHAPEEADPAMREHYTHSPIEKAFEALEHLSADERARMEAEARAKALSDEATLLRESFQRGEARGEQKERAAFLLRLLEQRFGPLPQETRQRIQSAKPDILLQWGERILSAKQLDDVFDEPSA